MLVFKYLFIDNVQVNWKLNICTANSAKWMNDWYLEVNIRLGNWGIIWQKEGLLQQTLTLLQGYKDTFLPTLVNI